jgi:hypothetical protein
MASTVTESHLHGRLLHLFSGAIASIVVALVIARSRPDSASLSAGDVVDRVLAARQLHDTDAAMSWFESDVSVTDSAGTSVRGREAARRLVRQYNEFDAGPRQVNGSEVIWTETIPHRSADNFAFEQSSAQLATEVPRYASVQPMCALVTDGKIHALVALDTGSPRSCRGAEPSTSWNLGLVFAATATIASVWLLAHRLDGRPRSARRGLIQALGALPARRATHASGVWDFDKNLPDLIPAARHAVDVHALTLEPFSVFAARFSLAVLASTAAVVLALHLFAAPTSSERSPLTQSAESDPLRVIPDSPNHADRPLDTHSNVQPIAPFEPT